MPYALRAQLVAAGQGHVGRGGGMAASTHGEGGQLGGACWWCWWGIDNGASLSQRWQERLLLWWGLPHRAWRLGRRLPGWGGRLRLRFSLSVCLTCQWLVFGAGWVWTLAVAWGAASVSARNRGQGGGGGGFRGGGAGQRGGCWGWLGQEWTQLLQKVQVLGTHKHGKHIMCVCRCVCVCWPSWVLEILWLVVRL